MAVVIATPVITALVASTPVRVISRKRTATRVEGKPHHLRLMTLS